MADEWVKFVCLFVFAHIVGDLFSFFFSKIFQPPLKSVQTNKKHNEIQEQHLITHFLLAFHFSSYLPFNVFTATSVSPGIPMMPLAVANRTLPNAPCPSSLTILRLLLGKAKLAVTFA